MYNKTPHNPFEYRTTPKNNWELLWWSFVDKNRVIAYVKEQQFTWWQERMLFLKVYCYLAPIVIALTFVLWLLGITAMAGTDLLNITPAEWWRPDALQMWQNLPNFTAKFAYLFHTQIIAWVAGLAVGLGGSLALGLGGSLALGLAESSSLGLAVGLAGVVALGLAGGLGGGLAVGLAGGLGESLAESSSLGLAVGLALGLAFSLARGLAFGLGGGLAFGLARGLAFGLVFGLVLVLGLGFIYLTYYLLIRRSLALDHNSYLIFGNIDVSLFVEPQLIAQTQEDPKLALQFVAFLWQHRPKQHNLAALLSHVAFAEIWKDEALTLREQGLSFPDIYEQKRFAVPLYWQEQLAQVKEASYTAQTTPQISLKVRLFKDFIDALQMLYNSTLVAPQKTWFDNISMTRRINWYSYYSEAVAEWLKIAQEKYAELQKKAEQKEPIAANNYQPGGALSPTYNQALFMERDDLKAQLTTLLHTTQNVSVLFLQGQRRVGKTSLLKFMPQILGNRFHLAYLDLQGNIQSIPDFLEKWHKEFCREFGLEEVFKLNDNWSETFTQITHLFSQTAIDKGVKIILAIDEYEELQKHLAKDVAQARQLLGAIRHFTQHQHELSIMFVGLQFFSELQNPNWNEYFPQAIPIKVDYLNKAKTFQLIEVSGLEFEEGMKQHIYDLTQGHPCLIQKICHQLVQIANHDGRRHLNSADLEESLKKMYVTDNGVVDIFWTQNCNQAIDKEIVRAVIEQRPMPPKSRQRLVRLIEYGFIVEHSDNTYTMRVPIFETWVKRFGQENT